MNFFLKMGMGWGIRHFAPIISRKIKNFFESHVDEVEARLKGLDNLVESKLGDIFPDEIQKNYDDFIHHAVEFVEGAFTKEANIRFALNAVMRGKNSLKVADLKKWSGKSWESFLKDMPQDLKDVISDEKSAMAVKIFSELWGKVYNAKSTPAAAVIVGSLKKAVKVKNANHKKIEMKIGEESFTQLWERLTTESQERQGK